MNEPVEIRIVLPPCSDDEVSDGLRRLTQAIHEAGKADGSRGGLLGGEYGYGANFENDTFMMHRYCWCEEQTCPWCAGCECPEEPRRYEIGGREVAKGEYEAYWVAYDQCERVWEEGALPPMPWNVWPRDVHSISLAPCRVCRGEFGNAPHFLHKPSGSEVRWYKYIGRGMEMELKQDWQAILIDCLASIAGRPA